MGIGDEVDFSVDLVDVPTTNDVVGEMNDVPTTKEVIDVDETAVKEVEEGKGVEVAMLDVFEAKMIEDESEPSAGILSPSSSSSESGALVQSGPSEVRVLLSVLVVVVV